MADNVSVNTSTPGSPAVIASDEIGGSQFQRVKVTLGGDGINEGDVSSINPMPVLDNHAGGLLQLILKTLRSPFGYDKALARYRQTAIIESGTVTTVTTVTTASNLVNIDGRNGAMLVNTNSRAAWAMSHRSRIT